jgi:hypothetical protein
MFQAVAESPDWTAAERSERIAPSDDRRPVTQLDSSLVVGHNGSNIEPQLTTQLKGQ